MKLSKIQIPSQSNRRKEEPFTFEINTKRTHTRASSWMSSSFRRRFLRFLLFLLFVPWVGFGRFFRMHAIPMGTIMLGGKTKAISSAHTQTVRTGTGCRQRSRDDILLCALLTALSQIAPMWVSTGYRAIALNRIETFGIIKSTMARVHSDEMLKDVEHTREKWTATESTTGTAERVWSTKQQKSGRDARRAKQSRVQENCRNG